MKLSKELIKGSGALLVLSVLERGDLYGYAIIRELEARSEKVFSMKEGTLYPILHALESEGFVESYWEETDSNRRRRYYKITESGRSELLRQTEEFTEYTNSVRKVLGKAVDAYV